MWTLPNILSITRLFIAPLLLLVAWQRIRLLFLVLFLAALLTDALDGFLARKRNQVTELGAKLDSWGDLAMYTTLPLCIWWLWPALVKQERWFVAIAIVSFILPVLAGLAKYKQPTSYHTRAVKIAAVLLGITIPLLLLGGPAWPFRWAVAALALSAVEELAITATLPEWQANVPSYRQALKRKRKKT